MFKILGADGKEYGPVTADQLKQWIAEGRANQETMVQREGETGWRPLSQYPEFSVPASAPVAPGSVAAGMGATSFSSAIGSDPGGRTRAQQLVNAPAICLIIAAALGILNAAAGIVMNLLGIGMMGMGQSRGDVPPEVERFINMFAGGAGVIAGVIGLLVGLLIIYAAIQMRNLKSHGLAVVASVLSMIPCVSPCCLLGLPFGIWALVVLLKPEVKSQFQ